MAKDTDREIVQHIDKEFASLIKSLKDLARSVPPDFPYQHILRSAAVIEQMCGGLTANLWDDPFEWTLPETLATPDLIVEHLSEVDALRERFFASLDGDDALRKYVAVPSGEPRSLIELLTETLVRASDFHKKAQKIQKQAII